MEPEYLQVLIGRYNFSDYNEFGSIKASVWEIILYPDWNIQDHKYEAHIAIVVLTEPVEFNNKVQPICLPEATTQYPVGKGVVPEWGKSNVDNDYDEIPNQREMSVVGAILCLPTYPKLAEYDSKRLFCAKFANIERESCTSDSGPAMATLNSSIEAHSKI